MGCSRRYEIVIKTPLGDLVDLISNEYTLRWTLRANKVGALVLELPAEYCSPFTTYGIGDFTQDCRIELWRYIDGVQSLVGQTCFFVNYLAIIQGQDGNRRLRIEAESALGLAGRRTIAYKSNDDASDLEPDQDDPGSGDPNDRLPVYADSQLHRVMRDHFSDIATSYNTAPGVDSIRTAINPYITIDFPIGPQQSAHTVEMNVAHQPVLQALGRIADSAFAKGEALFFDIQQISNTTNPFLEFVTGIGQLGTDRTITSGGVNAVVIDTSDSGGSISDYTLALDWRESAYRVYAGSQGRGEEQVFQTVDDGGLAALIATNPFALREAYISTNELTTDTQKIIDQATGELARLQPKLDVHGTFAENETFQWGVDWDFHDRLTLLADGTFVDVFVETIEGELTDGGEKITGTFATSLHRSLDGIARVVQDTKRLQWWVKHLNALEAPAGAGGGTVGTQTAAVGNQMVAAGYSYTVPHYEVSGSATLEISGTGALLVV